MLLVTVLSSVEVYKTTKQSIYKYRRFLCNGINKRVVLILLFFKEGYTIIEQNSIPREVP
jgi:hypothetical protein